MASHDPESDGTIDYIRAIVEAAPLIGVLLVVSTFGYYYAPSRWWVVVLVFGAFGALVDRVYAQKAERLGERLRKR